MCYLESNSFIYSPQFDLRKGLSTSKALIKLLESVTSCYEQKAFAEVTLYDLNKAFDCVPHNLRTVKLEHLGIKYKELQLIKSYLNNRWNYV